MVRDRVRKGTRVAVDDALAAEGLSGPKDREAVAESLRAVLDALPPAPSSPLDAGVRRRMRAAAETLSEET